MALQIIAFTFKSFFQPPLDFFANLFASASELHLLLYLLVFGFYGKALEDAGGSHWFAATYLAGALAGNLTAGFAFAGFHASPTPGVGVGIMALLGTVIAMHPLAWVVAEYFPLPAFAAAFFIFVKFLLDQGLDVLPLFLGIAFGYVIKEAQEIQQKRLRNHLLLRNRLGLDADCF